MFDLSLDDVRNFFFGVYQKFNDKVVLTDLEKIAHSIILEHPEYLPILNNPQKYLNYIWHPQRDEVNPFLHLSLHLSIIEQVSIDQPLGIKDLYHKLLIKYGNQHEAEHQLMDCLVEMIWQAQQSQTNPNPAIYLDCIYKKLGIN